VSAGDLGRLDGLVGSASVILVIGPGGVGKTTLAAALASRAAVRHGRRALVVTVDPARRLADALGVSELPSEPVVVPLPGRAEPGQGQSPGQGRLWAFMVDMARSWDELVVRHAPNTRAADDLLANALYRSLTTRFIQSHDYIALDHLCGLADDDRYELVVIDTPPSTHAIDVLDAPDRMIGFFGSRLLRWLTAPYRSRLANVTARPFLAVAERLLGGPFLAQVAQFFWLFSQLQPGFVARATQVRERLDDPATRYVLATTSDPAAVAQTELLLDELVARHHQPSLVIHNRIAPVPAGTGVRDLGRIADPSLRAAMEALLERDRLVAGRFVRRGGPDVPVVAAPWRTGSLHTVEELAGLFG
jgi:anion-transporting  ArsA/GET3 family ATPase